MKEGKKVTTSLTDYSAENFVKAAYIGLTLLYVPLFLRIISIGTHFSLFGNLAGPIIDTIAIVLFFMLFILPYLLIFSFFIFCIYRGLNEKTSHCYNRIFLLFMIGLFTNFLLMHY